MLLLEDRRLHGAILQSEFMSGYDAKDAIYDKL